MNQEVNREKKRKGDFGFIYLPAVQLVGRDKINSNSTTSRFYEEISPRMPRFVRPVAPPKRILTQNRKDKIRQFKEYCKVSTTDYGNPGSESWRLSLLEFMDERETLTIYDLNRWIDHNNNAWIIMDEPRFDARGRSARMQYRNGDHLYNGANADDTWAMHPENIGVTIPNYSPIRNATEDNQPMASNLNIDYQNAHENQPRIFNNAGYPNGTEEMSVTYMQQSSSWHQELGQQMAPPIPNIPITNSNATNVTMNQSMELDNEDLYSEDVLADLTEMTKHLAPLNKLCGGIEVVQTLLIPMDEIVKTVLRAQRKCMTVVQYKGAMAAKSARIRQIKMELLNGGDHQDNMANEFDADETASANVEEIDITG